MEIKQLLKIILPFTFLLVFSTCKKSSDVKPSSTFIKEFGDWPYQININNIREMGDNGFLMVGCSLDDKGYSINPFMLRTSKNGDLIRKKLFQDNPFPCGFAVSAPDGSYLLNSLQVAFPYSFISKIDTSGQILSTNKVFFNRGWGFFNSPAFYAGDGNIITSMSDGVGGGGIVHNYVITYDNNLNFMDTTHFYDNSGSSAGHTLMFNAYHEGAVKGSYYVYGMRFPKWQGIWNANYYLYAAIAGPGTYKWRIAVIDSQDRACNYVAKQSLVTADTGLVLLSTRSDNSLGGKTSAALSFVDKNLNIVWHRIFDEPGVYIYPFYFSGCKDGGFIICGGGFEGTNSEKPYAIKVDKNGIKIWSKTFPAKYTSVFTSCAETRDGGFIFAGSSLGFGDQQHNSTLLIKTDAIGNY